jgi:hypothetical protein
MALNGISELATKELRQKSKLDLAAAKRAADGNLRATYDLTLLPTQYNDNDIINNPNAGGLVQGRPWITTPVEIQLETFTVVQTTDWTAPAGVTSVDYLVVGGGGGGGNGYDRGGGGGGAAGMMLTGTLAVTPGVTYTVIVGDGGSGGADERVNNAGTDGEDSVFATITALGGIGGQGSRTFTPTARFTGGAAQIGSTTSAQPGGGGGGAGSGGGGGGAAGAGGNGSGTTGGVGGAGLAFDITGSSVTYAVGGAGGGYDTDIDGADGTNNRGNGGVGGGSASASSAKGGNGGTGIVVLKYLAPVEFTFYEAFGTTTAISTTQFVSGNKIFALSSTFDVPGVPNARVVVNDIEVLNVGNGVDRGHHLVVLDSYGDLISATRYDTFETALGDGGAPGRTALTAALNAVTSGNIIVLVVYDASSFDATLRTAINTGYGSTNTETWTASRISHIFIGEKI